MKQQSIKTQTSWRKGQGRLIKKQAPGPSSKNKHDDEKNTDLSPPYSAQQNLR